MIRSINPATNETLWEGQRAGKAEVDAAVNLASRTVPSWSRSSLSEREAVVRRFGELLEKNKDQIALTISQEMGKPLWESKSEVGAMIGKVETSIAAQKERCPEKIADSDQLRSCTRHKPLGVCAVFGPYNFPGHLPNGHIIPALLAGNTVVLKPSELTPLASEKIIDLWREAGLPEGVVNLVQGDAETGQLLAGHPLINALFFTGSWRTGKILAKQFGSHPDKLLALEMGGNNPLVLGEIKDVEAAAYALIQSAYLTSGQRCTCARRLIIQEKHQTVMDRLLEWIPKLKLGPYDSSPEPFMGPVVSDQAAEGILKAQSELIDRGATPLLSCTRTSSEIPLITPGLLDVTSVSDVPDQEVFGPLLQIIRVNDFDSSIQEANRTAFGLAASLLSESAKEYDRFFNSIRTGVINWNRPTTGASGSAPFGGVGHSGNYRPSAYYAADYCNYPVASLESATLTLPESFSPGIPK